eukprot:3937344-Rhodomonas_salina.1
MMLPRCPRWHYTRARPTTIPRHMSADPISGPETAVCKCGSVEPAQRCQGGCQTLQSCAGGLPELPSASRSCQPPLAS